MPVKKSNIGFNVLQEYLGIKIRLDRLYDINVIESMLLYVLLIIITPGIFSFMDQIVSIYYLGIGQSFFTVGYKVTFIILITYVFLLELFSGIKQFLSKNFRLVVGGFSFELILVFMLGVIGNNYYFQHVYFVLLTLLVFYPIIFSMAIRVLINDQLPEE